MNNQYELIQQYLDGFLKGKELLDFERQLQSDKALSEEVELMREVRPAIALHKRIEGKEAALNTTLTGLGTKYFSTESPKEEEEIKDPKVIDIKRILAIAATILLLLNVLSAFYANQQFSNKALAANFSEMPLRDTDMGQNEVDKTLKEGKTAFFDGAYEKAKNLLQTIPNDTGMNYQEGKVFLAYTALATKEYESAITNFTLLLEQNFNQLPNVYKDENKLRWNRLLAYVGNGQTDTSFFKAELAYFLNSKSIFYQQKAKGLQKSLASPWRRLVLD